MQETLIEKFRLKLIGRGATVHAINIKMIEEK